MIVTKNRAVHLFRFDGILTRIVVSPESKRTLSFLPPAPHAARRSALSPYRHYLLLLLRCVALFSRSSVAVNVVRVCVRTSASPVPATHCHSDTAPPPPREDGCNNLGSPSSTEGEGVQQTVTIKVGDSTYVADSSVTRK